MARAPTPTAATVRPAAADVNDCWKMSPPLRDTDGRRRLERFVANKLFHPEACPTESTIRVRVRGITMLATLLVWEASAQPRPRWRRVSKMIAGLPRYIGAYLDRESAGEYGNSIKAIDTQLRRLLKQRKVPRPGLINSAQRGD